MEREARAAAIDLVESPASIARTYARTHASKHTTTKRAKSVARRPLESHLCFHRLDWPKGPSTPPTTLPSKPVLDNASSSSPLSHRSITGSSIPLTFANNGTGHNEAQGIFARVVRRRRRRPNLTNGRRVFLCGSFSSTHQDEGRLRARTQHQAGRAASHQAYAPE